MNEQTTPPHLTSPHLTSITSPPSSHITHTQKASSSSSSSSTTHTHKQHQSVVVVRHQKSFPPVPSDGRPISTWSTEEVCGWFQEDLLLPQLVDRIESLEELHVGTWLSTATDEQLQKDLGITSRLTRKKILQRITDHLGLGVGMGMGMGMGIVDDDTEEGKIEIVSAHEEGVHETKNQAPSPTTTPPAAEGNKKQYSRLHVASASRTVGSGGEKNSTATPITDMRPSEKNRHMATYASFAPEPEKPVEAISTSSAKSSLADRQRQQDEANRYLIQRVEQAKMEGKLNITEDELPESKASLDAQDAQNRDIQDKQKQLQSMHTEMHRRYFDLVSDLSVVMPPAPPPSPPLCHPPLHFQFSV